MNRERVIAVFCKMTTSRHSVKSGLKQTEKKHFFIQHNSIVDILATGYGGNKQNSSKRHDLHRGLVAVKHLDLHDPNATFVSGSFSTLIREGQEGMLVKDCLLEGSLASVGDRLTIIMILTFLQLLKNQAKSLAK